MGQTVLRRIRSRRGLTQREMGALLGVSQVQISRLEGRQCRVTPDLALRVAKDFRAEMSALELDLADLLYPCGTGD